MATPGRKPRIPDPPPPPKVLNTYGLGALGYDGFDTGNWLQDQLLVEATCFRIGLRPDEGGLGKFGHFQRYVDLLWNNPDLPGTKKVVWNSWTNRMLEEACRESYLSVAGCASAGKSGPFALWAVANYAMNPSHTKILVMSTTIKLAKERIWGEVLQFWGAVKDLPGRLLESTNVIKGLNYERTGYGESSGIKLLASEKSAEAAALENLIGIKAPKTGEPDDSYEALSAKPEFADLVDSLDEDYLRELLPRLNELENDRFGKLIIIIDEATSCAQGVLNALLANTRPGNEGRLQIIMIGNPSRMLDVHGQFSEPKNGWDSITDEDDSWETTIGGKCITFDASKNPRITEKDERLSWMPTKEGIATVAKQFGVESLYYYRMVKGRWFKLGMEAGVYSEADFISTGAMKKATWGYEAPKKLCSFDPSFTIGGDRASCTFFNLGHDVNGLHVLQREEVITIMADASDTTMLVPHQLVRNWKLECRKRNIPPENCAFDATGGGISFASIVHAEWSSAVMAVSSGGKASKDPIGAEKGPDGKKVTAAERYGNKATEIWYGAKTYLRSGQIKGVTAELAKEICSRQHSKENAHDSRVLQIESKRKFKAREKGSPDDSDSFFIGIELAKRRHGFRSAEKAAPLQQRSEGNKGSSAWEAFKEKARRITRASKQLKRK